MMPGISMSRSRSHPRSESYKQASYRMPWKVPHKLWLCQAVSPLSALQQAPGSLGLLPPHRKGGYQPPQAQPPVPSLVIPANYASREASKHSHQYFYLLEGKGVGSFLFVLRKHLFPYRKSQASFRNSEAQARCFSH